MTSANIPMLALGVRDKPYTIIGNSTGVVVTLMPFTIAFAVSLLYSVLRTISTSLEAAATVHVASAPTASLHRGKQELTWQWYQNIPSTHYQSYQDNSATRHLLNV
ncbi:MAG: hypothetical protein RIS90_1923 [Pseudomonadota bacterium]